MQKSPVTEPARASEVADLLQLGLAGLDLALDQAACGQLLEYLTQLERANQAFNLTGVRDPRDMVGQHLLDSLVVVPWLEGATLLDMGSGGGLPGIPIAVARPDLAVTLLDGNLKKTRFLDNVVRTLRLDNVQVVRARAEDYHPPDVFSMVIARAVGSVAKIVAQASHLIDDTGRLLLMRGVVPEEELAALRSAKGSIRGSTRGSIFDIEAIRQLDVPNLNKKRCLVVLRRTGHQQEHQG